jgi:hypothetical protein
MKLGWTRTFLGASAIAVVCLIGAATLKAQAPAAQPAGDAPAMVDDVFRTVVLLKGIPLDQFLDAMGMFANAMGNDCTFCHSPKAALNRAEFATPTPRLQRARQMIVMMQTINKQFFGGMPRVTCFTCHHGTQSPRSDPNFALQYGPPIPDPIARDIPTDPTGNANQIFDKYIQAVGGAAAIAKLTGFSAKGTYLGFDTAFTKVPAEVYAQAPGKFAAIVHMDSGDSYRTYDGTSGWHAGPDTAVPIIKLTTGNLDRYRLDTAVAFPTTLRNTYSEWRVGRTADDDQEYMVLQASENGQPILNLYFDEKGMLTRLVRFDLTPVGFVPTQIDYSDYRTVAGVKIPFKKVISQTYMQATWEFNDIQANPTIPATRFQRPAPFKAPAPKPAG